jgi:hypothetical protein
MPGNSTADAQAAITASLPPELVQQFSQMATLIPAEEEGAVGDILQAILCASTWEQLDTPWESCDASRLVGKIFRIDKVRRRPTRCGGSLGMFLVVRCTDGQTGERFAWTSSSVNVCAQLVRAYAAEWLPLFATVNVAARAAASGYRPHYLKFFGKEHPGEVAS